MLKYKNIFSIEIEINFITKKLKNNLNLKLPINYYNIESK